MANREGEPLAMTERPVTDDFRPHALRQSLGLVEHCLTDRPAGERRCSEQEMLQHFLEIESSRERLRRQTREAEVSAQAKSDFLAMMSHEMRTPLNGIIGMTAVLLAHTLSEQERDCVETIRHSGEVLLGVIDEVLDLSKIEAGRLQLECAEFHPAAVIGEALQVVECAAARKPLTLVTCIEREMPKVVRGDSVRIRQILLNLLSNAIKFTPAGKIDLHAGSKSTEDGGYELFFSVTDDGIGISEAQQQKLFRPFSQATASTTRQFGGTGLGLTICKKLAELMGGGIGVKSRLGHGSCFWFTVKVRASEGRAISMPMQKLMKLETAAKPFRLLLVDDNRINQKVALMMLKKLGYDADIAKNGREALAAIASRRYDLVLMDCIMPEMDGFEATRLLRSSGGLAAMLPVIAMTASAFAEDREACLAAGMNDYLSKPVRESELVQKLESWLPAGTDRKAVMA